MKPFIFQLPITKNELVGESKIEFSTSQINSQPLFKYGFHHYINQTKDKLVILDRDDLKGKNFYNIIENFNDVLPNYNSMNGGDSRISDTGYWTINDDKMDVHHAFDKKLCIELLTFFAEVAPIDSVIIDIGCGRCDYINYMHNSGRKVAGVDGNPLTVKLSKYAIVHDLSKPLPDSFPKSMTVISFEVGEHLPKIHEKAFIDNLASRVLPGGTLVMSWARPGQGGLGHVNEQPNTYIIDRMTERGFVHLPNESTRMRKASTLWWFKDTILVFKRQSITTVSKTPSDSQMKRDVGSSVDDTSDSISNVNKKYLGKDVKNNQLELWEILSIFGFEGSLYINDEDYDDMIKMFYNKTGLKYKAMDDPSKVDTYININSVMGNIKFLEQTQYSNLIEAICEIGEGLNKKGNCIIRIYDSFTDVTVKLIKLVSEMFEETYIYKPYMTYARDSTKYIIGMNFKDNFKNSKQLRELLKHENKLNNIYNSYIIPENFEFVMKYVNVVLGNYEHKMINTLVEYIKKSNYFGDTYHNALEHQKETSKFWIETFYPKSSKDYKKTKDNLINIVQMTIKENNKNMNEMFKVLI